MSRRLMIAEIFPIQLRGRAMAIGTAVNRVVSGTVALTFLSLSRAISQAGACLFAVLVVFERLLALNVSLKLADFGLFDDDISNADSVALFGTVLLLCCLRKLHPATRAFRAHGNK